MAVAKPTFELVSNNAPAPSVAGGADATASLTIEGVAFTFRGTVTQVLQAVEMTRARLGAEVVPAAVAPLPCDDSPLPRVEVFSLVGKFASQEIRVDGQALKVPACVVVLLHGIAAGNGYVRARKETTDKASTYLPWLMPHLQRDTNAKVIDRLRVYAVSPALRNAVKLVPAT